MRAAVSATSDASASNFLTKYARASSALFPGYEPTGFSPSLVLTKTVPSSPTRPNCEGSPISAVAALANEDFGAACVFAIDVGLMSVMISPFARRPWPSLNVSEC